MKTSNGWIGTVESNHRIIVAIVIVTSYHASLVIESPYSFYSGIFPSHIRIVRMCSGSLPRKSGTSAERCLSDLIINIITDGVRAWRQARWSLVTPGCDLYATSTLRGKESGNLSKKFFLFFFSAFLLLAAVLILSSPAAILLLGFVFVLSLFSRRRLQRMIFFLILAAMLEHIPILAVQNLSVP